MRAWSGSALNRRTSQKTPQPERTGGDVPRLFPCITHVRQSHNPISTSATLQARNLALLSDRERRFVRYRTLHRDNPRADALGLSRIMRYHQDWQFADVADMFDRLHHLLAPRPVER